MTEEWKRESKTPSPSPQPKNPVKLSLTIVLMLPLMMLLFHLLLYHRQQTGPKKIPWSKNHHFDA
ncbi:hypothetical protein SK128_019830, partial [Halocaridina rubra]